MILYFLDIFENNLCFYLFSVLDTYNSTPLPPRKLRMFLRYKHLILASLTFNSVGLAITVWRTHYIQYGFLFYALSRLVLAFAFTPRSSDWARGRWNIWILVLPCALMWTLLSSSGSAYLDYDAVYFTKFKVSSLILMYTFITSVMVWRCTEKEVRLPRARGAFGIVAVVLLVVADLVELFTCTSVLPLKHGSIITMIIVSTADWVLVKSVQLSDVSKQA